MLIEALLGHNEMRMHAGLSDRPAALQIGRSEHELRRLLALAGLPEPVAVEPVAGTMLGGREVAWREFLRSRNGGQATKTGYGFRIEFPEAIHGPVAVGRGGILEWGDLGQ
jgi:hypothetical protein